MSTIWPKGHPLLLWERGTIVRGFEPYKVVSAVGAIVLLAACGGGGSSSGGGLGTGALLVGVIAPFTGADAGLGPAYYAACLAAAPSINNNGGVGGRQVSCQKFDTRGEPADAVPAANAMIASNSNLMAVVGCTSDEAATVAPIIDRGHIPMFCMTGQTEFNKTTLKYFHRLVPADIYDAYAMVGSALYGPGHAPYKKAALVFGNDIGSQAFVAPATNAFTKLGGTIAINQPINLTPGTSYRTEVAAMLATHPDVILTEALGAAGTYLKEVKTQNGGQMIPFIGTSATIDPQWFQQVRDAIGVDDLIKYYAGVDLGYAFSGPAYDEFITNLNAAASTFADAPKYRQRGSPTVYNSKIKEIANGTSGATVVNTYKDGVAAIRAGKSIQFVGAGGQNSFDAYNNSAAGYIWVTYDNQGNEVKAGQMTPQQTATIAQAGGI